MRLLVAAFLCTVLAGCTSISDAVSRSTGVGQGSRIAFVALDASAAGAQTSGGRLLSIGADGGNLLESDRLVQVRHPQYSPDGSMLIFHSDRGGAHHAIYVSKSDGTVERKITDGGADDVAPGWAPDGRRIAFSSKRNGNADIYVMNADGSAATRLTTDDADDDWPAWSPDGREIAFTSTRDGLPNIYIMSAGGSPVRRLTSTGANYSPKWSPDGKALVFMSQRDGVPYIYVAGADGSNERRLSNGGLPQWSPDGKHIAFIAYRSGRDRLEIYTISPDGSHERRVTDRPGDSVDPTWIPATTRERIV